MHSVHLVPRKDPLIQEAYQDFILSRRAALLSDATIDFYDYTAGNFVWKLEISEPIEIDSRLIREYLTQVHGRGVSSSTIHAHARGVRAFVRSLYAEEYIDKQIQVTMPRVEVKPIRVLSEEEIRWGAQGLPQTKR